MLLHGHWTTGYLCSNTSMHACMHCSIPATTPLLHQQLLQQQPCDCLSLASLCLAHAAADAAHMQAAAAADSFDGSTTVCCLAIPADMSVAHFCSFIGAYLSEVRAIQVSRFKDTSLPTPSPRLNPRYSALIRLPSHYTKQTACLPQSCEHPSSASLLLLLSCNHKYIVVYLRRCCAARACSPACAWCC